MKTKLTLILFLISILGIASNPPEIEKGLYLNFDSEFKIQSTFSSNIGKYSSLHLIIGKNKIKAFKADKNLNISEIDTFSIPKKAKVVGLHMNGEVITIILSYSEGNRSFIQVYDLNFNKNNIILGEVYNNDNQIITTSTDNCTFIVYSDKKSLSFRKILSSKESKYSTINFEDKPELYKLFKKNYHYQFIDQKQYLPTGPFSYAHTYINDNNQFVFILDYKRKFKFAKIDPEKLDNTKIYEIDEYPKSANKHSVKFNAKYFHKGYVFFFYGSSKGADLKIIDVNTHKITKVITLLPDDGYVKKNGKKNHYTFKKYLRSIQSGTKEACITVNELVNNQEVSIRFDYVQTENDMYYSPFYIPLTNPKKPIKTNIDMEKKDDYTYHYIILNEKFDFTDIENLKFKKLKMDKLLYIDFAKKRFLKHASHVFLNNKYRSFSFDKRSNKFVLQSII